MLRGPLGQTDAQTRFSGHETFPLRRLWLRKAYEAVRAEGSNPDAKLFHKDHGLIRFGVGKNMVFAIRHWAKICKVIIEQDDGTYTTGPIGDFLFNPDSGVDPFMEELSTIWLLHWTIVSDHVNATTWYYAFSHMNAQRFDYETLAAPLRDYCAKTGRARSSAATIKRDVEVFVRSYVSKVGAGSVDDQVESVLGELNLIDQPTARSFEFRRGPKPSLPNGVFVYALTQYWQGREARLGAKAGSLSVEEIVYEPGSPGRLFKLDEDAVIDRLAQIPELSEGAYVWSDTAGVRSVARRRDIDDPLAMLGRALSVPSLAEAS